MVQFQKAWYEDEVRSMVNCEINQSLYKISYQPFLNMIILSIERTKNNNTLTTNVIVDRCLGSLPTPQEYSPFDYADELIKIFGIA